MKSFSELKQKEDATIRQKFKSDGCILDYCDSIFHRLYPIIYPDTTPYIPDNYAKIPVVEKSTISYGRLLAGH